MWYITLALLSDRLLSLFNHRNATARSTQKKLRKWSSCTTSWVFHQHTRSMKSRLTPCCARKYSRSQGGCLINCSLNFLRKCM